jgi:pimeloyl-ACP methyl ester carboxylesterase
MDALNRLRRGYVDSRYGQLHVTEAGRRLRGVAPTLICLHATAYSSRSLAPLIAELGLRRHVVAIDTPGYGGSDGPPHPIAIEDYARTLVDALGVLGLEEPADVFGYHTGATIAFAAASMSPARFGRLVAIGVPLFTGATHAVWRTRLAGRHALGPELAQFAERWDYLVAKRPNGMPLSSAFANFVDELRAWPNGWWAHAALFDHDLAAILPGVAHDVLIINPDSALAPMSREAAAMLPHATLRERPDLGGAIFEKHASDIMAEIEAFLDHVPLRSRAPEVATELAETR